MQNEMTNKRIKIATERYAEAIQDLFSKYETIKHHLEKQEEAELEKFNDNVAKQSDIIEKFKKRKEELKVWKQQECKRLEDELNQEFEEEI